MTIDKKKTAADMLGAAIGATCAMIALSAILLLLFSWPLMLWIGAMHSEVSAGIPAVSYPGAVSIGGVLWSAAALTRGAKFTSTPAKK